MKGTYDSNVHFTIYIRPITSVSCLAFDFGNVYGLEPLDFCKQVSKVPHFDTFILEGIRCFNTTDLGEKVSKYQTSTFEISAEIEGLTFEDTIRTYLTDKENWKNFTPIQKIHAQCFLQKYCMEYEEVKEKVKMLQENF